MDVVTVIVQTSDWQGDYYIHSRNLNYMCACMYDGMKAYSVCRCVHT